MRPYFLVCEGGLQIYGWVMTIALNAEVKEETRPYVNEYETEFTANYQQLLFQILETCKTINSCCSQLTLSVALVVF